MVRRGYGESNGKIILIGEHAVTFGQPAIAIPFTSGKVKVLIESLEKGNYSAIQSDVYDGPLYDAPDHLKSLITHFVESKHVEEPLLIKIQANLPPSRGLGSSAAVAVAFIRASYDYLELPLSDKELLENADWAERIAHGKPSGIDTKTIVTNQPVWYQKGEVEILKSLDLDGYMVVIDTGVKGSTKQAVEDVHRLCDNDESYMNVIEHIGALVYLASDAINHHSFDQLANIFNQCQDDLRTLTVSHDKIETLLEIGRQHGAVAGKLTGGGRGGSMLILTKEEVTAKTIAAAEKDGAQHTWIEKLGG